MRRSSRRARLALTTLLGILLGTAPALAQCMMCRTALQSPEARVLAAAFRQGILVLLVAPLVAFGLVAFLAIRSQRRLEARRRRMREVPQS